MGTHGHCFAQMYCVNRINIDVGVGVGVWGGCGEVNLTTANVFFANDFCDCNQLLLDL